MGIVWRSLRDGEASLRWRLDQPGAYPEHWWPVQKRFGGAGAAAGRRGCILAAMGATAAGIELLLALAGLADTAILLFLASEVYAVIITA